MSDHARLSPSGSSRWMRCAASINLTQGLHEGKESPAAAEGTRAHTVLERALRDWTLLNAGECTVPLDEWCDNVEMRDHIQTVFDYIIMCYEAMPGANKRILIESRVDLHYMTLRDDLWGKADVVIYSDDHINVIDLKYGQGIFVAADTSQNRIYLLGVMCMLMKASKQDANWKTVTGTIVQPRYPDANGETVRVIQLSPKDLLTWKDEILIPAAAATDNPDAEPVASEEACRFCLAKPTCPAVADKVRDLCSVFEPAENIVLETLDPGGTESMDIERLIEVHDQIPFIEGYLKAVSKKIRDMLEARDPALQGKLKLVRSRQQNVWTLDSEELAIELSKGKGRILKADLFKSVVISAPQALKLKSLKPAQKKKLQDFIKKSEGSLSIVPDSDPRSNCFPVLEFEPVEVAPEQPKTYDFL